MATATIIEFSGATLPIEQAGFRVEVERDGEWKAIKAQGGQR